MQKESNIFPSLIQYFSLSFLVVLLFSNAIKAQHQNLPLNYNLSQQLERNNLHRKDSSLIFHSAVKPAIQSFTNSSLYDPIYNDSGKYYYTFTEKLYKKNLLSIEEKDLKLVADPLFNIAYGKTTTNDTLLKISSNVRGVRVAGDITSKFSFETRVYETQSFYPIYLDSIATAKNVAFGFGRSKLFKDRGRDVAMSMGYFSYTPIKQLNIQFGQGKQFIGNGYRSLLLSDNSSPAPYLKLTTQLFKNRLLYQNINSWMQTMTRLPATHSAEALFKRKGSSFRYLSFAVNQNFQIGLFEGVIYKNYVDSIGKVPLAPSFYIPIIGVATAIDGLKGENNSLLGINMNYNIKKSFNVYGQYVFDDTNKKGFQIGAKWFDIGGLKKSWVQLEYNNVEAFTYSTSSNNIIQNYVHSNQELAHPLGANFSELIVLAHAEKERWLATGRMIFYTKKSNKTNGLGSNPLLADDLATDGNKYTSTVSFSGLEVSYLFNRKTNMQLFGSYYYRNEIVKDELLGSSFYKFESFWQIGFRTNLINLYHDI